MVTHNFDTAIFYIFKRVRVPASPLFINLFNDRKNMNGTLDEGIIVDCDVTITIRRKAKLTVSDAAVFEEGSYEDGDFSRQIDFESCDWNDAIEENQLVPDGWELVESEVTPIQW